MFVKGLSTRHTAIGTFRFGVVYEIDDTKPLIQKHVLPLLEGETPALEKLSKAAAEKEKAKPTLFVPEVTAPDKDATAADLRGELKVAQKAQKEAEDTSASEKTRADEAEDKVEALKSEVEKLEANVAMARGKAEEDVAAAKQRLDDAATRITTLEGELEKSIEDRDAATSALTDCETALAGAQKEIEALKTQLAEQAEAAK